jgi:hypothetical protein
LDDSNFKIFEFYHRLSEKEGEEKDDEEEE